MRAGWRYWVAAAIALGCDARTTQAQQPAAPPKPPAAQTPQPGVPPSAQVTLPSFAPMVDTIKGAVVNVEVRSRVAAPQGEMPPGMDDFFRRFFGGQGGPGGPEMTPPHEQEREGLGSGTIIDKQGRVLTNNHVVEGAVEIRVKLDDGREFNGKVLGRDPLTDVALVQLQGNPKDLPSVPLGDSDAMRVGDWVIAIGNPFGLASSVSVGILSAKARELGAGPYDNFLQTDAAINPGNSGGPLFNLKGEVIGINTAIVGGGTGIGFAVPSNMARELIPQLEKAGVVTRGWLGVGVQDLTPELAKALGVSAHEGAVVVDVNAGTPAAKAGLKGDDIITSVDGQPVRSAGALTRSVAQKRPGSTVTLGVLRKDKQENIKVVLGTRPDLEGVSKKEGPGAEEEQPQQRIGMSLREVDPRIAEMMKIPPQGALVAQVVPGSPAERAGLEPGEVIVEANRKPVNTPADLMKVLRAAKPGDSVLLRIRTPHGGGLRALELPK